MIPYWKLKCNFPYWIDTELDMFFLMHTLHFHMLGMTWEIIKPKEFQSGIKFAEINDTKKRHAVCHSSSSLPWLQRLICASCFINVGDYLQLKSTCKKENTVQIQTWLADGPRVDPSWQWEWVQGKQHNLPWSISCFQQGITTSEQHDDRARTAR